MFQTKAEIFINRPIEDVYNFIADNENDPQWCVPVIETDRISGDVPGANTRYSFASKAGMFTLRGEFQITDFVSNERIAWEGQSSINVFTGEYKLSEEGGGTHLIESSAFSAKGILRLFEASMTREIETSLTRQLQNLKQLLEE
jgi:uncharacterized membrane protein